MTYPTRRVVWWCILTLGMLSGPVAGVTHGTAGAAPAIARQGLTLNFGDFQAKGELTYPAGAAGKSPTVILIPGSTPEDMNADIPAASRAPLLSHIFLDIATYLAPRGVAVVRYNKHYVSSRTQVETRSYYTKLTLSQMLADAEVVLTATRSNPHVDPTRIFVYGWSEGSTVAAALAVRHPELAGLIVQGAVALSWKETFLHQITDVGLPYLHSFAPTGRVTATTLQQASSGRGGGGAKTIVLYMADPTNQTQLAVSPSIDVNHDGVIDIATEFLPRLSREMDFLLSPRGVFSIYGPGQALPTVTQQAAQLKMPVLILQGANDANTVAQGARLLNAALKANRDHTLKVYPGLGHSLGVAANPIDDNFRPIAPVPLADLAGWLARHR